MPLDGDEAAAVGDALAVGIAADVDVGALVPCVGGAVDESGPAGVVVSELDGAGELAAALAAFVACAT